MDFDSSIKKVNRVGQWAKGPFDTVVSLYIRLEVCPVITIYFGIGIGHPHTIDIVDISSIEGDSGVVGEYSSFMNCEEQSSIITC